MKCLIVAGLGTMAALAFGGGQGLAALPIAENGKTDYAIVVGKDAPKPDRFAAEELKLHLEKATGATFPILEGESKFRGQVEERKDKLHSSTSTSNFDSDDSNNRMILLRRVGKDEGFKPEECRVRTKGPAVLIEGEGDRGVLYGVYAFLERKLGVRWFEMMPDGMVVPPHPSLTLEPFDFREKPFFAYRGYLDYEKLSETSLNRVLFMVRNRLNVSERNFRRLEGRFVAREPFHHPMHHQLYFFLPPEPKAQIEAHGVYSLVTNKGYFASHPEWYSLRGKKRVNDFQLCFTNPAMREEFLKNFLAFVEHKAKTEGESARHGYYALGAMDTPGSLCDCEKCQALEKRHDTKGAPYFDFINWMCESFEKRGYDLGLVVSAYRREQTQRPPKGMKMHPKTMIWWAPIDADQSKTYDHPNNAEDVETLRGWCALAPTLNRDYTWSYGPGEPPACPFGHIASGLRIAAELGATGVWFEHAPGLYTGANATDMGTWVYMQLMRDPLRDWKELAREYARARYGAAGDGVMAWILDIERLDRANPKHQLWSHRNESALTAENLYRWQKMFDAMEAKVRDDPRTLDRLIELREAVDAETLPKYREIVKAHPDFTDSPEKIRDRLLDTLQRSAFRRRPEYESGGHPKQKYTTFPVYAVAAEQGYMLATHEPKPLPPELAKYPADRIMQFFTENQSQQPLGVVEDAALGVASYFRELELTKYHDDRAPIPCGLHDWKNRKDLGTRKITSEEIVPDQFHFYRICRTRIPTDDCRIHIGTSWGINTKPMSKVYEPGSDQEWDVYVSLKFEGPGYSPKSKKAKNQVYYDRTVFVKAEK